MQKNNIFLLLTCIFLSLLFLANNLIKECVLASCNLFITKIFPSLFPMFIISDLLMYFGLPELLCKYLGPFFSKIFHTSPYGAFAFFMSLFSGTPTNAYIVKNLVEEQKLSSLEGSYILSFAFFTNPLFYFSMLKSIFNNQPLIIFKLLLIPYLVNLLLGFIFRDKKCITSPLVIVTKKKSFSKVLINSIEKAMHSLLMILGTITFFYIINALLNPLKIPYITGLLEVSQGLTAIEKINIPLLYKELWTIIFVSFGGLSILLQIKSIILDTSINFKLFLKRRFYQIIISIFIILLT